MGGIGSRHAYWQYSTVQQRTNQTSSMASTSPPPTEPSLTGLISLFVPPTLLNPANIVLIAVLLYLVQPIIATFSPEQPASGKRIPTSHLEGYSWMPEAHPPAIVWKEYTPRTLRPFDGNGSPDAPILFAIRGKVYDVSSGRNFYGPGGPYGNFAGRDASRGLAKQSFEMDMLVPVDGPIDDLSDLTPSEWDALRDWEMHFNSKYFQCGDFVENY